MSSAGTDSFGDATNDGHDVDRRPPYRVFLASSFELQEERRGFDDAIRSLESDRVIARSVRMEPVRWETGAAGYHPDGANRAIALTTDFPTLDTVVVVVWRKVGKWTLEEYDTARRLQARSGRPRVLVYVRDPEDGCDVPPEVAKFREDVFEDHIVAKPYKTAPQLFELLKHDLTPVPGPAPDIDQSSRLRRSFLLWGVTNLVLGLAFTSLSRIMSFPTTGVTYARVLATLVASPLLLLTTIATVVAYRRLLTTFEGVWRSPSYSDRRIWLEFHDVIPSFVMPRLTRAERKRSSLLLLLRVLLTVALAVASGPIGAANAVFNEILVWEYVVGWETVREPAGGPRSGWHVESKYVDRGRSLWPLELQAETPREFFESHPGETIYVHAQGQFCDVDEAARLGPDQHFRCNLGPEVKLPLYAWLFVLACAGATAAAGAVIVWLATFRRRLSLLDYEY